jgi:dimethylhistidine N-methyltransferase
MKRTQPRPTAVADFAPETEGFRAEVLRGLRQRPKELPCKYFYDARGSRLFEQICELDEYYLTRAELAILRGHVAEMAARLGRGCQVIEYGSGSGTKTRILLDHLHQPAAYVPIDIAREHLESSAGRLAARYPGLAVLPVWADFTGPFELPPCHRPVSRRVVYFPGSTIGNFDPAGVTAVLRRIAALCGRGGGLLIGVDLRKDPHILERANNDGQGVTRAFNLNLLARINRELGADFRLDRFRHHAFYNRRLGRIEMHLVSLEDQTVRLDGEAIPLAAGESIHTESSYKYSLDGFRALAAGAGLDVADVWTDERGWFSVQYLTV